MIPARCASFARDDRHVGSGVENQGLLLRRGAHVCVDVVVSQGGVACNGDVADAG